ncbi:hypothetical protein CROQUDRAFT_709948 [Cronartium quercuum f. sp. fusiforme G11]|uniref:Uncharacterized protein n=1 Tax=Cronartium quercuum f. sp. fusiforme G11 TaxID=708437 RepID=A0A9P6T9J4_9BASI|nr:hypothetical protein CROQUDRAFT_709948 [Cronartium quercuum f. sp. fusiforme G11]
MVGFPGKSKYLYLAPQAILLSYHVLSSPTTYDSLEKGGQLISTFPADRVGPTLEDEPKVSLGSNEVSNAPVIPGFRVASPSSKDPTKNIASEAKLEPPVSPERSLAGIRGKQESASPSKLAGEAPPSRETSDAALKKKIEAFPELLKAVNKLLQSSQEDLFKNLKGLTNGLEDGTYGDDGDAALLMFLTHDPFKSDDFIIWQHLQVFILKSLKQNQKKQQKPTVYDPKRLDQLKTNEALMNRLSSTFTAKVVEKIESVHANGELSTFIATQRGLPDYLHQSGYENGQEELWLFWPKRYAQYVAMKENYGFVKDTDAVICTKGKTQRKNYLTYLRNVTKLDHERYHSDAELAYIDFMNEWLAHAKPPFCLIFGFGVYALARCDYKSWKPWNIGQKMTVSFLDVASKLRSKARKARARLRRPRKPYSDSGTPGSAGNHANAKSLSF